MSNWERRPLSDKQLEYAALDAFVLLDIYDVIADPEKGLSQQQLQSLAYSYIGQKRQRSGPIPSSNSQDQPESLPDHADTNMTSKSVPQTSDPAAEEYQPATAADSGPQATSAASRQGQFSTRQPNSSQYSIANGDEDNRHDGHGSSLHEKQAEHPNLQHNATAPLPAGSPLQDCLQRNSLQHAVRGIAPGTG